MLSRRQYFLVSAAISALFALPAFAAEMKPWSAADFDAAQKAGRSILVEVHAPWCPTCKAQQPILDNVLNQPAYKNLLVVKVDFDTDKDALKKFGVHMQSTLITFKGGAETGRSVGDTNKDSIATLVAKAI